MCIRDREKTAGGHIKIVIEPRKNKTPTKRPSDFGGEPSGSKPPPKKSEKKRRIGHERYLNEIGRDPEQRKRAEAMDATESAAANSWYTTRAGFSAYVDLVVHYSQNKDGLMTVADKAKYHVKIRLLNHALIC